MRKLALVGLVTVLGCGGGSSTPKVTTDPASLDFCLQWANGVCRLAYLCVDTGARDATFHARYGTSTDDCWQGLNKLCTSNQTGTQAFGPSCGPGKTVSQAAKTTCTDSLDSQSCVDWTATPAGDGCGVVCGGAAKEDAGAPADAGSGNDAGTGSDAATGSVATGAQFCSVTGNLTCDRAFECAPASSAAQFGNVAGCKALIAATCSADPCPDGYSPTLGAACVAATKAASCQDLMGPAPTVCSSACQ